MSNTEPALVSLERVEPDSPLLRKTGLGASGGAADILRGLSRQRAREGTRVACRVQGAATSACVLRENKQNV